MQITPIKSTGYSFCGEARDFKLDRSLSKAEAQALRNAIAEYPVLVFRNQKLSDEQQIALASIFGKIARFSPHREGDLSSNHNPAITQISNVDEHGKIRPKSSRRIQYSSANQLWHSDLSYLDTPGSISILHARECVPEGQGGETEFADMRAAYDAISAEEQARYRGMVAYHSTIYSRRRFGFTDFNEAEKKLFRPVPHPLVRRHPVTQQNSLYISSHIGYFHGLSDADSERLLSMLMASATRPVFRYSHNWNPGDVVIWDNQCTMHRGRPYDQVTHRRIMHRTMALVEKVIAAENTAHGSREFSRSA